MARLANLLVAAILGLSRHACPGSARPLRASKIFLNGRDIDQEYDYIIVGGGTAGLTVADRLTEDGRTTVLVVEYGDLSELPLICPPTPCSRSATEPPLGNSSAITTVQGGFMGMSDPRLMFNIRSEPQVNLRNRTVSVLAGKVVGGSSAVNAMMTVRGTAEDYDRWGSFFGNKSHWSWQGLLPYFKRALNFVPPDDAVAESANITYDTSFWGNTSGVYAAWPSFQYAFTTAQMDAFRGIPGIPFVRDSGSGEPGVYWYPTFMDPHTVLRSYARSGHYDETRENYHLATGSKVTNIVLDGTRAAGVRFVQVGADRPANHTALFTVVRARKEVILAAGAIHSPQILQRSGIGQADLLASANITAVVDLPGVGQNFQDHPMLMASYVYGNVTVRPSADDFYGNATFAAWARQVWAANRTGPYSIATGNAAAWLPFPAVSPRADDLAAALAAQDHAAYLPPGTHPTVQAGYRAQMLSYAAALRGNRTAFYNLVLSGGRASGIIVALHPLSRGVVDGVSGGERDADADAPPPRVDYRALSNPLDAAVMADLLRFTRRYHLENERTAGFAPRETVPGLAVQTDDEWRAFLEETMSPSEFHPAGTCAMLPRELGGVVDEELRVYGVEALRVVDAAIIPTLPGANTCQTVYAIAEKVGFARSRRRAPSVTDRFDRLPT